MERRDGEKKIKYVWYARNKCRNDTREFTKMKEERKKTRKRWERCRCNETTTTDSNETGKKLIITTQSRRN